MPGATVNLVDTSSGRGVQSATGKWMVVGMTERGPVNAPVLIRSLAEYKQKLGARVTYGFLYDAAEAFFKDNGAQLYVGRVVGPAAAAATVTLLDGSSAAALTVKANGPGAWANGAAGGLKVVVTNATSTFTVAIQLNGVVVETSPAFSTIADAVAWSIANSQYVVLSDPGGTALPATVAATNLAGGADDRASATTASWSNALALFGLGLGGGQVSAPGNTTTAIQQAVLDHCVSFSRVPLIDLVDNASSSTVAATVASLTGEGLKRGGAFAPWAVIPGLTSTTRRTIPYSAIQAAAIARNDGTGDPPSVDDAVAGDNAISSYAIGLSQTWVKADRDALIAARVNPARVNESGQVETYGNVTLANPDTWPAWAQLSAARTLMYATHSLLQIARRFVFQTLDPQGRTIQRFGAEQQAFVQAMSTAGQIYNDPATAVDLSGNTTATARAKQLVSSVTVQPSPDVDDVILNIFAEAV